MGRLGQKEKRGVAVYVRDSLKVLDVFLGSHKDSLIGSDRFNNAVLAVRVGAKGP